MKKYLFIFSSAILITFSVYPFNLSFLSFIFFVPAIYGIYLTKDNRERLFLSLFFGISIFVLNFFWAIKTMEFYGKMPATISYLLGIPLSIYQTLPFIIFLFTFPYLFKKNIVLPAILFPLLTNLIPLIFPYSISSTLSSMPVFCKTAEIWGEWGLDFLIVLTNTLFFSCLINKNKKHLITAVLIILILPLYFFVSTSLNKEKPFSHLETVIIQPCIYDSNMPETKRDKFFQMLKKIEKNAENKVLIIPESSLPDDIERAEDREEIMSAILQQLNLKAILYNTLIQENNNVFNSEILLSRNSFARYNKIHLMLFGEYFPIHSIIQKLPFPFANYENFTSGKTIKPLRFQNIKISTPICLEGIYQNFTSKLAKNSNLIVNPTDDEWFLSNKAKMLHFAQTRLKAVENRRYLITATNNGYTAIVNPDGRIVKDLKIDKEGYLIAKIPLLKGETIFQNIAGFLPYIFSLTFLLLFFLTGKNEKSNNS